MAALATCRPTSARLRTGVNGLKTRISEALEVRKAALERGALTAASLSKAT